MVIKFNNNGYNVIIVLLSVQNTVKPPPATTSHKWLPIENTLELRYTKPPYFKVLGITNDFLYRSISMEKNLDILTKPCYSRQILPFPKPFVNWCSTVPRSVSLSKYYSWYTVPLARDYLLYSSNCHIQSLMWGPTVLTYFILLTEWWIYDINIAREMNSGQDLESQGSWNTMELVLSKKR